MIDANPCISGREATRETILTILAATVTSRSRLTNTVESYARFFI
jgi:hypothetical protein